jgi:hypothetical protein
MAWPKIVYTPDGQTANTVTFTYPPSKVPPYSRTAVRHDNLSSAGLRESILERIDDILEVQVPVITLHDLIFWEEFFDYALTGGGFDYYPDSAYPDFTTYALVDTEASIERKAPQLFSAKFRARKQIV